MQNGAVVPPMRARATSTPAAARCAVCGARALHLCSARSAIRPARCAPPVGQFYECRGARLHQPAGRKRSGGAAQGKAAGKRAAEGIRRGEIPEGEAATED
ncbi:UNVERIFIED_CONTAM: hypothetical protein DV098_10765 [Bifidobacterium breve]|nr:hypothetical protein [Bifidobacterium breve]